MICSIDVKSLSVYAGSSRLMGPVSFQINPGGTLVVIGETGAGKSLVAQAIIGTLPSALSAEGEVTINGYNVNQLSQSQRAKLWGRDISMLPQEPWRALDPLMRSFPQVNEAHRFVAGHSQADAARQTTADFEKLNLIGAEQYFPSALSGGMAQRVAFAAATAANSSLLIADEPTKGLDTELYAKIVELLNEVPQNGGALMVITHEMSVALQLGGEILVLKNGALVERGAVAKVLSAPNDRYTKSLVAAEPRNWPNHPAKQPSKPILTIHNLAVRRGKKRLFEGFNLSLQIGEKVALCGPSGAGKTTLLDTIAGLIKPEVGNVSPDRLHSEHGIQKLYQDPPAAFPNRVTLSDSLYDVAKRHKTHWSQVINLLEQLGINPILLKRRPNEVSGGELQRIAIVRCLIVKPAVLLADEPTSRLDPITQKETLIMLDRIAAKDQIAIILVTHDQYIASKWADRAISIR